MTIHAVKMTDLQAALASARAEASLILDQVNFVQGELQNTSFVGEVAENLAEEMNAKMATFVSTSYDNVNELLRVIVNNMNVVVTKLGGAPWPHETVGAGQRNTAQTLRISANQDYEIDTDEMEGIAARVDQWFEAIATSYRNIRGTIVDGTPGWQGPEKHVTVSAVSEAVQTIVGSAGGENGVRGVGHSLSGFLRKQASVMSGV